jgi:hypothetical protein
MLKANQVFGCMRQHIFASKDVWNSVKCRLLTAMILPTLLDGAEHWVVTADLMRELNSTFNSMVRRCLRRTTHTQRHHGITTDQNLAALGMSPLTYYLDWKILGYAGHVQRMELHRAPKIAANSIYTGAKTSGGQWKSHGRQLRECLGRKGIEEENWKGAAQDRAGWRAQIKAHVEVPSERRHRDLSWQKDPDSVVGMVCERRSQAKYFAGEVTAADRDEETNEIIWTVCFDDGDPGDYNERELRRIVCEDQLQVFGRE